MYTFDGRIRYSEVDRRRKLTAEKTIDYFQDCTSFQSEEKNKNVKKCSLGAFREKAHTREDQLVPL